MGLYGDVDHVEKILRAESTFDLGPDVHDRLLLIQQSMSAQLEQKCLRTWGAPAADATSIYWVGNSDTLILDRPARSITSVTVGGTMQAGVYVGGTPLDADEYTFRPVGTFDGLIRGIVRLNGIPWGAWANQYDGAMRAPIQVVAQFVDTDDDTEIPADVNYATNLLMLEQFKRETQSSAGFTGPEGAVIPTRDPWKDPTVKQVIEQYGKRARWVV